MEDKEKAYYIPVRSDLQQFGVDPNSVSPRFLYFPNRDILLGRGYVRTSYVRSREEGDHNFNFYESDFFIEKNVSDRDKKWLNKRISRKKFLSSKRKYPPREFPTSILENLLESWESFQSSLDNFSKAT